jgi:hypothetical protein
VKAVIVGGREGEPIRAVTENYLKAALEGGGKTVKPGEAIACVLKREAPAEGNAGFDVYAEF